MAQFLASGRGMSKTVELKLLRRIICNALLQTHTLNLVCECMGISLQQEFMILCRSSGRELALRSTPSTRPLPLMGATHKDLILSAGMGGRNTLSRSARPFRYTSLVWATRPAIPSQRPKPSLRVLTARGGKLATRCRLSVHH